MPVNANIGKSLYRFMECTVGQYMTPNIVTVTRGVLLRELHELFVKHDFNAFPVVDGRIALGDTTILGIVTKFDFLRAFAFTSSRLLPPYVELMQQSVADVMTEAVIHVDPAAPLTRVLQLIIELKSRSLPVVAGHRLVGMISREDIMRALRDAVGEAD